MSDTKYVYFFGDGDADRSAYIKELLGKKGASLAEMKDMGIPVPPGFTIATDVCRYYYNNKKVYPSELNDQILEALKKLENATGMEFGNPKNPLLVSVRAGAATPMSGMMEAILNVGLNDAIVEGIANKTNNPRFAYDSYRRLIQMFSDMALGIDIEHFEEVLDKKKKERRVRLDTDLNTNDLKDVIVKYKEIFKKEKGYEFPQNPIHQFKMAINAAFDLRDAERATIYRRILGMSDDEGSIAVTVQAMVFGNMGDDSGTGKVFTRHPATGEKILLVDFLHNAQGEDIYCGWRTPIKGEELKERMPDAYKQLTELAYMLERYYKDMQEIDFTIQQGRLWVLNTRRGRRAAKMEIKISLDLLNEGIISEKDLICRIQPSQIAELLKPYLDIKPENIFIDRGEPVVEGLVVGAVALSSKTVFEFQQNGQKVIFCFNYLPLEELDVLKQSHGALSTGGPRVSLEANVCREMAIPCVMGCRKIKIDKEKGFLTTSECTVKEGQYISIDGTTGNAYLGEVNLKPVEWNKDNKLCSIVEIIDKLSLNNEIPPLMTGWLWHLRDIVVHNMSLEEKTQIDNSGEAWPEINSQQNSSFPFKPLSIEEKHIIAKKLAEHKIDGKDIADDILRIWHGLRSCLFRLFQRDKSISAQHEFYRTLFDPLQAIFRPEDFGLDLHNDHERTQCIGEEFFGINRSIPEHMNIETIRIYGAVLCSSPSELWRIDQTEAVEEKIIPGSQNLIAIVVYVNDKMIPISDLPEFYNNFRRK